MDGDEFLRFLFREKLRGKRSMAASPTPTPSHSPFPSPSPFPSSSHDEKPSYFWMIGLAIYITGTITMSAGLLIVGSVSYANFLIFVPGINLQKYALNRIKMEAERTNKKERSAFQE